MDGLPHQQMKVYDDPIPDSSPPKRIIYDPLSTPTNLTGMLSVFFTQISEDIRASMDIYVHVCACMYVHICVWVCGCGHVHIYIYIYICNERW